MTREQVLKEIERIEKLKPTNKTTQGHKRQILAILREQLRRGEQ